jgi:DNA-binding winged helix-turn-helix (wHTH) protein
MVLREPWWQFAQMRARLRTDLGDVAADDALSPRVPPRGAAGLVYRFADYTLDTARWELRDAANAAVSLAPLPFRLLLLLIEQRARVVSKDELLATLWNGTIVSEGSLTQAVSLARRALGGADSANTFIKSVRGLGYRFDASVDTQIATSPSHGSSFNWRAGCRNSLCLCHAETYRSDQNAATNARRLPASAR